MKFNLMEILGFLEEAEKRIVGCITDKKVSLDLKEIRINVDIVITDTDPGEEYIKLFNRGTEKK